VRIARAATAAATGLVLGLNADFFYLDCALGTREARVAATLAVAAAGAVAAHVLFSRLVAPRLGAVGRRARLAWIAAALLGGLVLVIAFPVRLPRMHRVEVVATGRQHADAKGSEVWVFGLHRPDGTLLPIGGEALPRGWALHEDIPVAGGGRSGALVWEGCVGDETLYLYLLTHPWSGVVEIRWDGRTETRDLYAPAERQKAIEVRLDLPRAGENAGALLAAQLAAGAALGLVLLALSLWLGTGVAALPAPAVGWGAALWPALACAAVWSVYLLAYWPGFMTSDSMDQWNQILHPQLLNNLHSAVNTLINGLLTRFWPSPAAVALAQLLALAAVVGLALREIAGLGVPWWPRALVTAAVALSPVNGVMVITLWKDIPYTIAMLGAFTVLLAVVRTRGAALRRPVVLGFFGLALLAVALYRHNGPPTVAALLVVLFAAVPGGLRASVAIVGAAVAVAFLVVIGPVFRLVGARGVDPYYASAIPIYQLGALVAADVPLDAEARDMLERLAPLERWRELYYCYSVNGVIWNMGTDRKFVYEHIPEIRALWLRLASANPGVILRHQWCATSLVWEISQPPGGYMFRYYGDIQPNDFGLVQESRLPAVKKVLDAVLDWTGAPARVWWTWRPALYLYAVMFCGAVATLRRRDPRTLLVLLPAVANSGVLMLVNVVQDFRYQYPVYMIGLIISALLWCRPLREPDA
jgi:hypothetical protein